MAQQEEEEELHDSSTVRALAWKTIKGRGFESCIEKHFFAYMCLISANIKCNTFKEYVICI